MASITNTTELNKEIALLEAEQLIKMQELRKQFSITYENLKPVKLIENALSDILSSPVIGKSITGTLLGMAAGFLTKKVAVGKSRNIFRNVFGEFLELGITKLIAQNPEAIKNIGRHLFEQIKSKKGTRAEETE